VATAIDIRDGDVPGTAPATRIPEAVWINRPRPGPEDGMGRAAKAFAVAILLGVVAAAAKYATTEPLVPNAVAGTGAAAGSGNGPSGYFPDQFDRSRLAPAEQPPSF
jgi:hypothetical protein